MSPGTPGSVLAWLGVWVGEMEQVSQWPHSGQSDDGTPQRHGSVGRVPYALTLSNLQWGEAPLTLGKVEFCWVCLPISWVKLD
jgi:hypothetical protein